jgi:hypothetical protein
MVAVACAMQATRECRECLASWCMAWCVGAGHAEQGVDGGSGPGGGGALDGQGAASKHKAGLQVQETGRCRWFSIRKSMLGLSARASVGHLQVWMQGRLKISEGGTALDGQGAASKDKK